MTTKQPFGDYVAARFGGLLSGGLHPPGEDACALEAVSQWRGLVWTDDPRHVGLPDIRSLNDGLWTSDAKRTQAMIPLVEALSGYREWTRARKTAFRKRIGLETVRQILADLPSLPLAIRDQCRAARTLAEANAAARAAGCNADAYTADCAADAAVIAADATGATYAGRRVRLMAGTAVLVAACRLWVKAAEETE